jgi:hypothetical protein
LVITVEPNSIGKIWTFMILNVIIKCLLKCLIQKYYSIKHVHWI